MLQVYCFYGMNEVQEVYRKLNAFLADLAGMDIDVPLDHIRANPKTYPDYGATATTIEVAIEMGTLAAYEIAGTITELHQRVLASKVEAPAAVYPLEYAPTGEGLPAALPGSDFDPFLDPDDLP